MQRWPCQSEWGMHQAGGHTSIAVGHAAAAATMHKTSPCRWVAWVCWLRVLTACVGSSAVIRKMRRHAQFYQHLCGDGPVLGDDNVMVIAEYDPVTADALVGLGRRPAVLRGMHSTATTEIGG